MPESSVPNPGLYSFRNLRLLYTPYVIGLSHPLIWGVPNKQLRALYAQGTGERHAEVGPGNGHFLRRLPPTTPLHRVELVDLNPAPLQVCRQRLEGRYTVRLYQGDALGPWPLGAGAVDSVGCCMVVHCLPGQSMADKQAVFAEAARVLRPGGRFFGATVLGAADPAADHNRAARRMLSAYNRAHNVFANTGDTLAGLRDQLHTHFDPQRVRTRVRGSVALWTAVAR